MGNEDTACLAFPFSASLFLLILLKSWPLDVKKSPS